MLHSSPFCEYGNQNPENWMSEEKCPTCYREPGEGVKIPEPLGICDGLHDPHEETNLCENWHNGPVLKPASTHLVPERAGREGDSQELPVINDQPDVQSAVIADIEARRLVGIKRYGTALQPHNGRNALLDLYEELLDACMYIKQRLIETAPPEPKLTGYATCNLCGRNDFPLYSLEWGWCESCETQRLKLGEAFLAETGTTWLFDKGGFILRTVRDLIADEESATLPE